MIMKSVSTGKTKGNLFVCKTVIYCVNKLLDSLQAEIWNPIIVVRWSAC